MVPIPRCKNHIDSGQGAQASDLEAPDLSKEGVELRLETQLPEIRKAVQDLFLYRRRQGPFNIQPVKGGRRGRYPGPQGVPRPGGRQPDLPDDFPVDPHDSFPSPPLPSRHGKLRQPREEVDLEEELSPKDDLIRRLLEYKRYRDISRRLDRLAKRRSRMLPASLPPAKLEAARDKLFALLDK